MKKGLRVIGLLALIGLSAVAIYDHRTAICEKSSDILGKIKDRASKAAESISKKVAEGTAENNAE